MSTIEKLFVQIFERKQWIIDQVKHRAELYDQHLASKLLIEGIEPPPWLLKPASRSQTSDFHELKKDELISGILLTCPQPTVSTQAHFSVYNKLKVAAETEDLTDGLEKSAINHGFEAEERSIIVPQSPVDAVGCITKDVPQREVFTASADQVKLHNSEICDETFQSASIIQRSRSRQKALELRKSAKADAKSSLNEEKHADIDCSDILGARHAFQKPNNVHEPASCGRPSSVSNNSFRVKEGNIVDSQNVEHCNLRRKFSFANVIDSCDGLDQSKRKLVEQSNPYDEMINPLDRNDESCGFLETNEGDCLSQKQGSSECHSGNMDCTIDVLAGGRVSSFTKDSCKVVECNTEDIDSIEQYNSSNGGRVTRSKSSEEPHNAIERVEDCSVGRTSGNGGKSEHSVGKQVQQSDPSDTLIKPLIENGISEAREENARKSLIRNEYGTSCNSVVLLESNSGLKIGNEVVPNFSGSSFTVGKDARGFCLSRVKSTQSGRTFTTDVDRSWPQRKRKKLDYQVTNNFPALLSRRVQCSDIQKGANKKYLDDMSKELEPVSQPLTIHNSEIDVSQRLDLVNYQDKSCKGANDIESSTKLHDEEILRVERTDKSGSMLITSKATRLEPYCSLDLVKEATKDSQVHLAEQPSILDPERIIHDMSRLHAIDNTKGLINSQHQLDPGVPPGFLGDLYSAERISEYMKTDNCCPLSSNVVYHHSHLNLVDTAEGMPGSEGYCRQLENDQPYNSGDKVCGYENDVEKSEVKHFNGLKKLCKSDSTRTTLSQFSCEYELYAPQALHEPLPSGLLQCQDLRKDCSSCDSADNCDRLDQSVDKSGMHSNIFEEFINPSDANNEHPVMTEVIIDYLSQEKGSDACCSRNTYCPLNSSAGVNISGMTNYSCEATEINVEGGSQSMEEFKSSYGGRVGRSKGCEEPYSANEGSKTDCTSGWGSRGRCEQFVGKLVQQLDPSTALIKPSLIKNKKLVREADARESLSQKADGTNDNVEVQEMESDCASKNRVDPNLSGIRFTGGKDMYGDSILCINSKQLGRSSTTNLDSSWPHYKRRKIDDQVTNAFSSIPSRRVNQCPDIQQETNNGYMGDPEHELEPVLQPFSIYNEDSPRTNISQKLDVDFRSDTAFTRNADVDPSAKLHEEILSLEGTDKKGNITPFKGMGSESYCSLNLMQQVIEDSQVPLGEQVKNSYLESSMRDTGRHSTVLCSQDQKHLVEKFQAEGIREPYADRIIECMKSGNASSSCCGGSSHHSRVDSVNKDQDMPVFESFLIQAETDRACVLGDEISFDELDVANSAIKRASVLEHLCKSSSMQTPLSQFASAYKLCRTQAFLESGPDGIPEWKDLGAQSRSSDDLDMHPEACIDSRPFPCDPFVANINRPCTSPVGKVWESFTFKFNSSSSERRRSSNPKLTCFPIREEENGLVDEVVDVFQEGNGILTKESSSKREPLAEIIEECSNPHVVLPVAEKLADRVSLESQNTVMNFTATCKHVNQNLQTSKKKVMKEGKENQDLIGGNGVKRFSESLRGRASKHKLSGKRGARNIHPRMSERDSKHMNIVSNITSFVPLVQQKQAAAVLPGKRDVKVKALEVAEAAKRLEEKKENVRKMKKEAMKLQRTRLEQEKQQKKMKEEEVKRKDADMATKKKLRGEEERKEKERKRKRIDEVRRHQNEYDGKKHAGKEQRKLLDCESKKLDNETAHHENLKSGKVDNALKKATYDDRERSPSLIENCGAPSVCRDTQKEGEIQDDEFDPNTSRQKSYELSPYQEGSDDEEEEDDIPNSKFIPSWASTSNLAQIAEWQQRVDTDVIFPREMFCDTSEVLPSKQNNG